MTKASELRRRFAEEGNEDTGTARPAVPFQPCASVFDVDFSIDPQMQAEFEALKQRYAAQLQRLHAEAKPARLASSPPADKTDLAPAKPPSPRRPRSKSQGSTKVQRLQGLVRPFTQYGKR